MLIDYNRLGILFGFIFIFIYWRLRKREGKAVEPDIALAFFSGPTLSYALFCLYFVGFGDIKQLPLDPIYITFSSLALIWAAFKGITTSIKVGIVCSHCTSENNANSKYCSKCGHSLYSKTPSDQTSSMEETVRTN